MLILSEYFSLCLLILWPRSCWLFRFHWLLWFIFTHVLLIYSITSLSHNFLYWFFLFQSRFIWFLLNACFLCFFYCWLSMLNFWSRPIPTNGKHARFLLIDLFEFQEGKDGKDESDKELYLFICYRHISDYKIYGYKMPPSDTKGD